MKVFISWSGNTGKEFATLLRDWFPSVLQAVKPFFSPDDIAKGARWSSDVGEELEASQIGIVVVTRESLSAPWIMFEAGALSKNVGRAKVVPILLDIEPDEVRGPLMQFQCAKFNEQEMKRVLRMVNSELRDSSLTENVLESVFDMWWPTLEKKAHKVIASCAKEQHVDKRSEKDLLMELLGLTKSIAHHQSENKKSDISDYESKLHDINENTRNWSGALTLATVQKRLEMGGNLVGANLMDLNLNHLDLSYANLRGANLVGADLSGATLINTNLEAANLEGAILNEADLNGALLSKTNLWGASMYNIKNIESVKSMDEANIYETKLRNVHEITSRY